MSIVTLTTEWRSDDIYSGIIKGKIYNLFPGAVVIDNASNLPVFNIPYASFVVRNTYSYYPQGTIHIICISTEAGENTNFLAVKAKGHYFIGTDNGIFNLILNSKPDEAVILSSGNNSGELNIFAETAAALLSGEPLNSIGTPIIDINEKVPLRATIDKEIILGTAIFIDSYGNVITNITRDIFSRVFEGREFHIRIQSNRNYIANISEKYCDVPDGELLARFNHLNLLEIAINGANVAELFNLEIGSTVRIDHFEERIPNNKLF